MQYNRDNRAFEGAGHPPTISDACGILTAERPHAGGVDDLSRYAALNTFMLNATGQSCTDVAYANMVAEMRNISLASPAAEGGRQWTYQTCVEFGYFQTSEAKDQPFGDLFPLAFSLQQCGDIYGLPAGPDVNWTNANYGGRRIQGTNIVFTNGDVDPWHALSVLPGMEQHQSVEAILIHGTAHWYPPPRAPHASPS